MDNNRIEEYLIKIHASLAKNKASLDEHMRRTIAAENRLELLEERLLEQGKIIWRAQGAVALFGILSTVSSLIVIVLQFV